MMDNLNRCFGNKVGEASATGYFGVLFFDIDNFKNQLLNCDKKNTALRLNLTGTLVHNDLSYLEETINEIRNEFIHFEENKYIKRRIDLDAINSEFVEGSLPHILLSELFQEDPDGMSTQKAFEAIKKNN